jgi:hypothetical protein
MQRAPACISQTLSASVKLHSPLRAGIWRQIGIFRAGNRLPRAIPSAARQLRRSYLFMQGLLLYLKQAKLAAAHCF